MAANVTHFVLENHTHLLKYPRLRLVIYFPSNDVVDYIDWNSKRAQINVIFHSIALKQTNGLVAKCCKSLPLE